MVSRSAISTTAGVVTVALLLIQPAAAQWRVGQETPVGGTKRIDVAVVENDSGHRLRIFSDDDRNVHGIFEIGEGFDTIDPGVCPTYRVDKREPRRVSVGEGRCQILPKQAAFTLGRTYEGRNERLRRIMNGSNIVFRYRLGGGNYRETSFTLRGSMYALTTAVEDLEVGADE